MSYFEFRIILVYHDITFIHSNNIKRVLDQISSSYLQCIDSCKTVQTVSLWYSIREFIPTNLITW